MTSVQINSMSSQCVDQFGTTLPPRKRPHSPDFLDEHETKIGTDHSCRRNNCQFRIVLESESPQPTDEDTESQYSVQLEGTVSAKDTSDTSWSSDESVTMDVEFEEYDVASVHSEEKLLSDCDSSGSDDMLYTATAATVIMAAQLHEDRALLADGSDLDSSDIDTTDSEVPRADYWECVRCKRKCTPLTRYCFKCFQLRKGYFPERPKRTHPRRRKRAATPRPDTGLADTPSNAPDSDQVLSSGNQSTEELPVGKLEKGDSGISLGVSVEQHAPESISSSQSTSQELLVGSQDSAPPEDASREPILPQSELCFMCVERPKNGAFIHKTTVHVLCCYQCALKVWNKTKRCPLCNNPPQNVARLIYG